MKVTVKAFAEFRDLLGREGEISVREGDSVRGLLHALGKSHPAFQSRVCQGDGNPIPAVIILLNGRNIQSLRGLDSKLAEGDVVAIFSPIAGG